LHLGSKENPMRRLGVLLAMALILVACGDDETTQDTTGREVTPTDTTTLSTDGVVVTLTVTGTNFAFDPVDPVVEVGESSTVHLINKGAPHRWVVLRQSVSAEQYIESIDSASTTAARRQVEEDQTLVTVGPGVVIDPVTFTIDKAGTYEVICDIPGHFEEGMEGTLVVE
jgi:uncharacterized cupredoxin-like copper-binding protein